MRKIIHYLNLNEVGVVELVFALTPMLSGFSLGGFPLSLLMWFILLMIVVLQGRLNRTKVFKPLLYFIIYWFIHTVVIMVLDNVNFNGMIAQIIYFASVFVLYPNLDMQKLRGSFNWVALIAMAGLLYQWIDVVRGGMVHPLEIPGLTMTKELLHTMSIRPSSFFTEPAAYVAFMICPLAISLIDKKRIWTIVIILSIFLTTSTTGLVLSFIMLGISVYGQKFKVSSMVAVLLIGTALFLALTRFDAFQAGVEKLQNTDTETNVRLTQGIRIVGTMESGEYIFGAPFDTPYNYCKSGRATNVEYYGNFVYMSSFWLMILCYGFVGLLLYLNIYYRIFKKSRSTWPLVASLCAVLFSSGYAIGNNYIFTLIVLLIIAESELKQNRIVKLGK